MGEKIKARINTEMTTRFITHILYFTKQSTPTQVFILLSKINILLSPQRYIIISLLFLFS